MEEPCRALSSKTGHIGRKMSQQGISSVKYRREAKEEYGEMFHGVE
jgi:hypothetical protein